jgi:two-component sensor histidine kinase
MSHFDLQPGNCIVHPQRMPCIEPGVDDWELLLREAHHRMMNTLTLLGASARREFSRGGSAELKAAVDNFGHRIAAFGELHRLLSGEGDRQNISVSEFFETLCKALLVSILEPAGICCQAAVEQGMLPSERCHRLALIITELVTNAARHAFPEEPRGVIRITMFRREGHWCCFVADNGVGANGRVRGVGSKLLESLCRSIHADIRIEATEFGTAAKIVLTDAVDSQT